MSITPGTILNSTCDESPLQGLNRVLQIINCDDGIRVVLIQIPTEPRQNEGAKQKYYYVKGFFTKTLTELVTWKEQKLIQETSVTWPALWNMTDEAIREKYPPRKGQKESYPLSTRDRKWDFIKPILPDQDAALINLMELERKAGERAIEVNASKGQVLDALHRYYAFGCVKNALLPNTGECGAPDEPRIAKKGIKLGRKNTAALVGNVELQGKILTDEDRQNLCDGWEMFVRPGTTVDQAFFGMSSAFYSSGYSLKHGKYVVNLLEAHFRPTIREFRYHGPNVKDEASAARRLMGEAEWLKNCRELNGSARTGVFAFGQVGSIDASPIDVNEVACFDPLLPIGVGRAVVVTDVDLGLIMGWHVAIGGIGTDDANLAILNAASSKAEMLIRYGFEDISPEDFPSIFFTKYLSDNGELRAIKGIGAAVEKLGSRIEFVPSGRADFNSVSESGHHSRNRGLNHNIEGTTKGRPKKRGEVLSITKALLSHFRYMRLLIKWIHWRNTKQEVRHLLTAEMRRDNVEPYRIAIYQWAKAKGYVAGKPTDKDQLRAHLLPTFTASIRRNGLVLHRPKTGDAVELLRNACFNDSYLATSGLIRTMQNGGKKHIEVKVNPEDLSQVYLFDKNGVHVIRNISNDVLLVHEGCIADLMAMNDSDRQQKVETASQRDQGFAEVRSLRVEEEAEASRTKKAAQSVAGVNPKPKTDRPSVRRNQANEKRQQLDMAVKRASVSGANVQEGEQKEDRNPGNQVIRQSVSSAQEPQHEKRMAQITQAKLKKFHDKRGAA